MDPVIDLLQTRFHLTAFRPGQEALIRTLLSGRDVLGILPTGGGKSLCYQLPALLLPGLTLVISPLISLMQDQVTSCRKRGISAAALTAAQTLPERRRLLSGAASGELRLLYVSPERLSSPEFLDCLPRLRISLVAIDEAHCLSAWGSEFRPAYLTIPDFIHRLPDRPRMAAFTATAAPDVRSDIIRLAGLIHPFCLTSGFDRPNLYYSVIRTKEKPKELLHLLKQYCSLSGVIYCRTRRTVEKLTKYLTEHRIDAVRYHAGLSESERKHNQASWISGEAGIIVATNAFGMGIDKPDVRFVIHYQMPGDPESYYQEAGRAGRDGFPADCILLYDPRDVKIIRFFISRTKSETLREVSRNRLTAMRHYCTGTSCLRASLLHYFGEHAAPYCGKCSVCLALGPFPAQIPDEEEDHELYRSLIAVRKQLADKKQILPYRIFSDQNLHDLARRRPVTWWDMALIEGIGIIKCKKYGADFLEEIRTFHH